MTHVRVGGIDIKIETTDDMEDLGEYVSGPEYLIRLSTECPDPVRSMVLIHEIIHAVSDQYGLEFSEKTVRVLETAMTQIIRDNPSLLGTLQAVLGD